MKLTQLEYFTETVICGSITEAAKKIGVSQPAVSFQLKQLEKEIKAPLLYKRGGRMRLTDPGRLLFLRATEVFAGLEQLNEEIKAVVDENRIAGNLSFGCGPLISRCMMPGIVRQYLKDNPEVNMSIFEEDSSKLPDLINEGKIVAGVGIKPPEKLNGVTFRKLFSDEFGAICSSRAISLPEKALNAKKLAEESFIGHMPGSVIHEILRKHIDLDAMRTIFHARNTETIVEFVKSGIGCSLVPRYLLRILAPKRISILPLQKRIPVEVGIFTRTGGYLTAAHKLFLKTITEKLLKFSA